MIWGISFKSNVNQELIKSGTAPWTYTGQIQRFEDNILKIVWGILNNFLEEKLTSKLIKSCTAPGSTLRR